MNQFFEQFFKEENINPNETRSDGNYTHRWEMDFLYKLLNYDPTKVEHTYITFKNKK